MITKRQYREAQKKAGEFLREHGFYITKDEERRIEVVDHGLGYEQPMRAQILVYINDVCCAKEIVLFPGQIIAEHRHPPIGEYSGKQETFRCRYGKVYLYIPGTPSKKPKAKVPEKRREYFTVWHEIILKPGEQYTIKPNTLHWFQVSPEGAIVSEFSTKSYDEYDIFTDPGIKRVTVVK